MPSLTDVSKTQEIYWDQMNPLKFYLFNHTSAVTLKFMFYPAVVIKTRLQCQQDVRYKGTFDSLKQIWKYEGHRGFFKGFLSHIVGFIPTNLAFVTTLEYLRSQLNNVYTTNFSPAIEEHHNNNQDVPWTLSNLFNSYILYNPRIHYGGINFVSAGCASVVASVIVAPSDVISQRLMVQVNSDKPRYQNGVSAFLSIMKTEGIRGLYRGVLATILVHAPLSAMYWATYSQAKVIIPNYLDYFEVPYSTLPVHALSACSAAVVAGTVTNPLDVVKTRMQVLEEPSFLGTLKMLFRTEGVRGLSRGIIPRVTNMALTSSIMLMVYEQAKLFSLKTL